MDFFVWFGHLRFGISSPSLHFSPSLLVSLPCGYYSDAPSDRLCEGVMEGWIDGWREGVRRGRLGQRLRGIRPLNTAGTPTIKEMVMTVC